jgi:hypothetical protein
VDALQPAELSLGRGARLSIVPEAGSNAGEMARALFQLFANQGYYQLLDWANLGQTINERQFQNMSFVENRGGGRIKGVDAFIYLQAEGLSGSTSDSSSYTDNGNTFTSYNTKMTANYIANYRAVLTSFSQIAGGRCIELSDSHSVFSSDGYPAAPDPYPMIQKMRNKAAKQNFSSLHPSVLKIRRVIGGTKSPSAKEAVRLANAGLWREATASAERGVQEMPADPEARYILAVIYQGTGRYAGADLLLIVSITKNRITQTRESVSAYGMTENIVRSRSDAGITVKALEVESGRIVAQRQLVKRTDNRRALDACAAEMKSALSKIPFGNLSASRNEEVPRHKVLIKPVNKNSKVSISSLTATRLSPQMWRKASAKSPCAVLQVLSNPRALRGWRRANLPARSICGISCSNHCAP